MCYNLAMKFPVFTLVFCALSAAVAADLDPLTVRWTFGNHEPISMYRRVGRRCTGGVEGSARWLEDWHHWFDSEACARRMAELGLNCIHSRFYKGMGWEFEKKDFPRVKGFVENCHKHGVKVLAYTQFGTLYPETLRAEIPDIEDWALREYDGSIGLWHGDPAMYYRWQPCYNSRAFRDYLKKLIRIALEEGKFDGIMFDNAFSTPCYCARCRAAFKARLAKIPDPRARFGFDTLAHVEPPPVRASSFKYKTWGQIQDPVQQEWLAFAMESVTGFFAEMHAWAHALKPDCVVCANTIDCHHANPAMTLSLDLPEAAKHLDLLLAQSGNAPAVKGPHVINRLRDLKFARALDVSILALCDGDAGIAREDERFYLLPLLEDLVFGGIPTDRTIMTPAWQKGFTDEALTAFRRPLLEKFNAYAAAHAAALRAPSWWPVRVLYPNEGIKWSERASKAFIGVEEILLRNHVPFGPLVARAGDAPAIPPDCEVLVVADQLCLSDAWIEALAAWAKAGGRLVVTGDSGAYDERNRQRFANPLVAKLKGVATASYRAEPDKVEVKNLSWTYKVDPPADGGKALMDDFARTGWKPAVAVENAPPRVLTEMKKTADGYLVHLLNYDPARPVSGVKIRCPAAHALTWSTPFEKAVQGPRPAKDGAYELPTFAQYAVISVK